MLKIRLLRIGKKHQPSYKIVVTDKRNPPKGGRFVAEVGSWNPLTKQRILKKDEIKEWISKGAQVSDTVYNMLVAEKVVEGKKIVSHKKSKKKAQPSPEATAGNQPSPEATAGKEEPKVEAKPAEKPEEKPKEEKIDKPA